MSTKFEADMVPVDSAGIKSIGYDEKRRALGVKFHSGALHVYSDVPPAAHAALMGAKSKGAHFQQHIRNGYSSTKL